MSQNVKIIKNVEFVKIFTKIREKYCKSNQKNHENRKKCR